MKKILVMEDDRAVYTKLHDLLLNAGYTPVTIDWLQVRGSDISQNIQKQILQIQPDMILMDINLPEINGEFLLRDLRRETDIPVIMVANRTSEADEVLAMSYGADDYITKPYHPTILLLRIAAIFKRIDGIGIRPLLYKNLKVNPAKGTLSKEDTELFLTKNEMLIFLHLLDKRSQIISRDELMTNLWDNNEFINDNALTVNISRLRAKLAKFGYPDVIETRKKQGYLLL